MNLYRKILEFFVRDSSERKRFINEFNIYALQCFQNLSIDALFCASTCVGKDGYNHELSAPRFASGFKIEVQAGTTISLQDIMLIGRIILYDQILVRKMFVLHWDTLIIVDHRTGHSVNWKIRDFLDFGGNLPYNY